MKDISHFWFRQRLENRKEHAESTYASSGLVSTSRLSPMVLYIPGFRGTSRWPHTHRPVLLLFVSYSTPTWEIKSVKMIKIALKTSKPNRTWSLVLQLTSMQCWDTSLCYIFTHGFPRARHHIGWARAPVRFIHYPQWIPLGAFMTYTSPLFTTEPVCPPLNRHLFLASSQGSRRARIFFQSKLGFRHTSRFTRAELLCHSFQCSRIAFHKGELRIASGNDETTWNDLKRLPQPETSWNRVETCKLYPPEHGKPHAQN